MKFILFAFAFLNAACTFAQQEHEDIFAVFNAHHFPCEDENQNTHQMNICSYEQLKYADSLLNDTYQAILHSIDEQILTLQKELALEKQAPKESSRAAGLTSQIDYSNRLRKSIVQSQKEWIRLRDANVAVVGILYEGGTARQTFENGFMTTQTLQRINELRDFNVK